MSINSEPNVGDSTVFSIYYTIASVMNSSILVFQYGIDGLICYWHDPSHKTRSFVPSSL